jgi:8-oxo-dGTP pyrophosphatase MutT (NUDIX family)/protein-tyrosine-phosphatase
MVILFVCMGNTFRSRLAEAYAKSLHIPGATFKSAGVAATNNYSGPIWIHTKALLDEENLSQYGKPSWTQLTQSILTRANIVVCLNREVYDSALQLGLKFPLRTYIWSITDVTRMQHTAIGQTGAFIHFARRTFDDIKVKVGELTVVIRRPKPHELVDVLNQDGSRTGRVADVDTIHTEGLWHNGVHGAVYTSSGELLMQRRSKTIIYNPGVWDFTFGGIVAAGEEPEETLLRELREEMGIAAKDSQVSKLFVWHYNHYWPHYALHSRVLTHTYLIKMKGPIDLKLQRKEVSDAKYLPLNEAASFIQSGKSTLGETTPAHHYYQKLLAEVRHSLS